MMLMSAVSCVVADGFCVQGSRSHTVPVANHDATPQVHLQFCSLSSLGILTWSLVVLSRETEVGDLLRKLID